MDKVSVVSVLRLFVAPVVAGALFLAGTVPSAFAQSNGSVTFGYDTGNAANNAVGSVNNTLNNATRPVTDVANNAGNSLRDVGIGYQNSGGGGGGSGGGGLNIGGLLGGGSSGGGDDGSVYSGAQESELEVSDEKIRTPGSAVKNSLEASSLTSQARAVLMSPAHVAYSATTFIDPALDPRDTLKVGLGYELLYESQGQKAIANLGGGVGGAGSGGTSTAVAAGQQNFLSCVAKAVADGKNEVDAREQCAGQGTSGTNPDPNRASVASFKNEKGWIATAGEEQSTPKIYDDIYAEFPTLPQTFNFTKAGKTLEVVRGKENQMFLSAFLFGTKLKQLLEPTASGSGNSGKRESKALRTLKDVVFSFGTIIGDQWHGLGTYMGKTDGDRFSLSYHFQCSTHTRLLNEADAKARHYEVFGIEPEAEAKLLGSDDEYLCKKFKRASVGSSQSMMPMLTRDEWILKRSRAIHYGLMHLMYYECLGGQQPESGGNELTGNFLTVNPFDQSNSLAAEWNRTIDQQYDTWGKSMRVAGFAPDRALLNQMYTRYLAKARNKLQPNCREDLLPIDGEDQRWKKIIYDPPQLEDVKKYLPEASEILEADPEDKSNTTNEWIRKNTKLSMNDRVTMVRLALHMAAADYYRRMLMIYSHIQQVPTSGPATAVMRQGAINLLYRRAEVDGIGQIRELQDLQLKQAEAIKRQLRGEFN